jgi:Na+/melibiose symporter-like transporter
MQYYLPLITLILFILGTLFILWRIWDAVSRGRSEWQSKIPRPLTKRLFEKRLSGINITYHEEMAQYDKFMPWAAGGAIALSLTLVSSISNVTPSDSRLTLGLAWLFLVLALLSSIFSHYTSTRIMVSAKQYLESCQHPPKKSADKDKWRHNTQQFQKSRIAFGVFTKLLNEFSGFFLIFGFMFLGVFAIFAGIFGNMISSMQIK